MNNEREAFDAFVEATSQALVIVDAAGTIRIANTAAAVLLGYAREELIGRPVHDLVPARHQGAHRGHLADFFRHRRSRGMESSIDLYAVRKDGREIPVDIGLSPVPVDGEIMVSAALLDLTAKRAREAEEARVQKRLSHLFTSQLVGSAIVDIENADLLGANDAFLGLVRSTSKSLHARRLNWQAMTPEQYNEADRHAFDSLITKGVSPPYDKEFVRSDGHLVPVSVSGSLAPGQDNHAIMVVVDQTERRRAEKELAAAKQRLEDSQRVAHVGSAEWAPLENEAWWTEEVYRLYDIPPTAGTLTYAKILQRIHPEDRAHVDSILHDAALRGKAFDFEHRVVRRDGSVRWIHNRGSFMVGGPDRRLVGVSQDITDRKHAEAEAAMLQKTRGELRKLEDMAEFRARFVSMAAHELKNPLTPMGIELHLLRTGRLDALTEAQTASLDRINRSFKRLSALIGDMLDATRLQAARLKLAPSDTDISRLVNDMVDVFRPGAHQEHIRLAATVRDGLRGWIDGERIGQVLANLLANALKFTPAGGRVDVHAHAKDDGCQIAVADTGPGLTSDQLAELFQPFKQVHAAPPKGIHGTGLGLYIAKGIVAQHGGRIGATSAGPGKGSSFWFWIPRQAAEEALHVDPSDKQ